MTKLSDADAAIRKLYGVEPVEPVYQPLYDSLYIKEDLTFFTEPLGTDGKSFSRTNMYFSGYLPHPQNFLLQDIHVDVTGSDAFRRRIAGQGWLELIIGNKTYLMMGPLGVFMPTRLQLKGRMVPRRFKLDEAFKVSPIFIRGHEYRFMVKVGLDCYPRGSDRELMYVHLGGHIYRPAQ